MLKIDIGNIGRIARDDNIPEFMNPFIEDTDPAKMRAWYHGWHARDFEIFMTENLDGVQKANIIIGLVADYTGRDDLIYYGKNISRIDSEQGFPAELSFTHFEETMTLTPAEKAVIIHWYLIESFQHRRNSGTSWKRLEQLQLVNCDIVVRVLETGKFSSIYHMLV